MKKTFSYSLLAALAATGLAIGAPAYTKPVGYVTATVGGNPSLNESGAETFISPSLVLPSVYAGAANGTSPSGGSVIAFSGGVPANLDGTYMLEIVDGAQAGWWTTVASSGSNSITVTDTFPASLSSTVKVTVRKFSTIQDVLGNNAPGLSVNDQVQVLDPSSQAGTSIVYSGGWIDFVFETPAGSTIIYPGSAIKIVRFGSTGLTFTISGEVKTTPTQVDVYPGENWLGQPNPTGGTFATIGFANQILGSDFINLTRPDTGEGQAGNSYVKSGSDMLDFVFETLANSEPIAETSGYYLVRPEGAQSIITIPAQVVAE